ncbi:O-methyltransferase [Gracilimonas mengyeensis]|uniref:Caffeoyl-CoA O-methyltransferase n=1 Tax=Gracilimonas mengyeensis TaxID=1302730 RepID=A0A521AWW2_9BACT|nr:O-methyltransferase [Gracilimonas mengyeensis]SMO39060.1 caffeoyl-CoA O-methyltransferase [Gracilimonas mengyeensis]
MKKHRDKPFVHITNWQIENYALEMTSPESASIQELVASSDEELDYIDMLSGNLVAQLLKMLINISGAKRILEIGTFTGYSAVAMAEALPDDGEVITLEMNIRYQDLAEKHFAKYDTAKKITLLKGNAQEIVQELEGDFDLVFIDADKLSYQHYYEHSLPLLKQGGLIVTDNVLWDGTVLEPQDYKAEALHQFNRFVLEDERVEQVLLPIRDGLTLIRKK